jgi:hypothetical protein
LAAIRENFVDQFLFMSRPGAGKDNGKSPDFLQMFDDPGIARWGPALETPAGSRVHHHEFPGP